MLASLPGAPDNSTSNDDDLEDEDETPNSVDYPLPRVHNHPISSIPTSSKSYNNVTSMQIRKMPRDTAITDLGGESTEPFNDAAEPNVLGFPVDVLHPIVMCYLREIPFAKAAACKACYQVSFVVSYLQ
jgi:hypothetical protein